MSTTTFVGWILMVQSVRRVTKMPHNQQPAASSGSTRLRGWLAAAAMLAVSAACAAPPARVVAGYGYAPPMLYWTEEKGPAGFAFEVVNEAARRENIRVEWRKVAGSLQGEDDLEQGRLDILPAGMDTPERRRRFFVSRPWWVSELSVVERQGGDAGGAAALRGKRLAMASPVYRYLARQNFPGAVLSVPDVPHVGAQTAATAVCSGAADAALVTYQDVHEFLLDPPEVCHGVPLGTFDTEAVVEVCVISRRDRQAVAARLRKRIDQLTEDGTLARIAARHPPVPARSAIAMAEALRTRYDERVLRVALFSALAVLVLGALFLVRQHRHKKVLQRSEARYQSLFDMAADGVVHVEAPTGRFLAVNPQYCKITGYSREELVGGLSFADLTDPDDRAESLAWYQRLVSGDLSSYSLDKRYVRRDGERVWVRVDVAGVRAGGKVLYVVGVVQDITERRKAEEALRESEDRLRLAIDSTGLGAFDYNLLTGKMIWSPYAKRQFGLPDDAGIDLDTFLRGIHPEDREGVERSIQDAQRPEGGGRYAAEYRAVGFQDGREHWLSALGRVIFDAQGRAVRFIGVRLDITERKQAEQALRDSERLFRELAESMPQLVWMADPGGRVTYYNGQWSRQLGIAEGEPLEESWYALLHPEDRERFQSRWRHSLASGEECQVECRLLAARGSYRWFLARAVPVRDAQGRVARWFGTCTDIDESKRAEERLRESQRVESVGLLAAGIAHDFNNLLTGVLGNVSLAIPEVGPSTAAKLAHAIAAAERGAHLTRQLLAYSGKGRFYVKDLDLSAAVREMEDLLRVSVPRSVEVRMDLAGSMPSIRMDPNQLQQVVLNLMINAGEALGEATPGVIALATGTASFEHDFNDALGQDVAPGEYVWVEVADTGPGMDPQTRPRIFDPFFTTRFVGRGLGLAAVAGIVRAQNGALTLDTAPGRGCRFRVHFPAVPAAPAQDPDTRGTILVVDEEACVREFLTEAVRRLGYRTRAVSDAAAALALGAGELQGLAAVIVDVEGPDRALDEMLGAVMALRPGLKILLTGDLSATEARRACTVANGAAFLQKPYNATDLSREIQALLE